ncbi:hypothetical protein DSUL_20260 [Desulfovibrionales bacterium]
MITDGYFVYGSFLLFFAVLLISAPGWAEDPVRFVYKCPSFDFYGVSVNHAWTRPTRCS